MAALTVAAVPPCGTFVSTLIPSDPADPGSPASAPSLKRRRVEPSSAAPAERCVELGARVRNLLRMRNALADEALDRVSLRPLRRIKTLGSGTYGTVVRYELRDADDDAKRAVAVKFLECPLYDLPLATRLEQSPELLYESCIHSFLSAELLEKRRVTPALVGVCASMFVNATERLGGKAEQAKPPKMRHFVATVMELAEFGAVSTDAGDTEKPTHVAEALRADTPKWMSYIAQTLLAIVAIGRVGVAHNDVLHRNVMVKWIDGEVGTEPHTIAYAVPSCGKHAATTLRVRTSGNFVYALTDFGIASVDGWDADLRLFESDSLNANYYGGVAAHERRLQRLEERERVLKKQLCRQENRARTVIASASPDQWRDVAVSLTTLRADVAETERELGSAAVLIRRTAEYIRARTDDTASDEETVAEDEETDTKPLLVGGTTPPPGFVTHSDHVLQYEAIQHYERDIVSYLNNVVHAVRAQVVAYTKTRGTHGARHAAAELNRIHAYCLEMLAEASRRRLHSADEQMEFVVHYALTRDTLTSHFGTANTDVLLGTPHDNASAPSIVYALPDCALSDRLRRELICRLDSASAACGDGAELLFRD